MGTSSLSKVPSMLCQLVLEISKITSHSDILFKLRFIEIETTKCHIHIN